MKKAIQEYIELKDIEKEALWNEAFFVFDTNVFLNLYRYSKKHEKFCWGLWSN